MASASCWSSRKRTLVSSCAAWNRLREKPARRRPVRSLAAQLADVVVEAGDLHPAGAGVVALGDQLAQLGDRVAGGAAGGARVHVLGPGAQADREAHQAAQTVGQRRPPRRQPDGVGHGHHVGAEALGPGGLQALLEVRAADLLFQLPQELQVGLHAVARGQLGAVHGGQRGALVVGGAAAEPARTARLFLAGELERRAVPLDGIGRLHVEVVVNGDRRPAGIAGQLADDQRRAPGVQAPGLGADARAGTRTARSAQRPRSDRRSGSMLTEGISTSAASCSSKLPRMPSISGRSSAMDRIPAALHSGASAADLDHRLPRAAEADELEGVAIALHRQGGADGGLDRGRALVLQERAQVDGVVVGQAAVQRPADDRRTRLQVSQKCSVIGEMMPTSASVRRRPRRLPPSRRQ